jgi:ATP-binding cassette, subfamily C, bacterial CydC
MKAANQAGLSSWAVLGRLLGFLRPYLGWVFLSVLAGVATIASGIGLLGTSAYVIARAALHPSIADLQVAIVGVRFFGITRGLFRYLERLISHSVNFRLLAELRSWFYQALEPLAPACLEQYQSGDLLGRAVGDIETLENFYVRAAAPALTALVVTVGMGLFTAQYDPRLGLVLVGGLLISGIALPVLANRLGQSSGRRWVEERARLSAALVENVQGMSDLLAYGQGDERLKQIQDLSKRAGEAQMRLAWVGGISNSLSLLVTNLTLLAVLVIAIPLVSGGQLEGILLAVLALLVLSSFEAVSPLPQVGQQMESSLAAARRLFALVDAEPEIKQPAHPLPAPDCVDIKIQGLRFRYAPDLPFALNGIDLDLPAGKHMALVGISGAGKTTLIQLLLRFREFQEGCILLDGKDIRSYRAEEVRRCMGVVSQSTYLFSATIRQNLRMGRMDASPTELEKVIRQAGLESWLAGLPEGADTWVGENGWQMSGGERQRLAVARTLLQDTPMVILDEPASHLDTITGQHLMDELRSTLQGKSVLLITHQIRGLEAMDEILVLRDGVVAERGTHAGLIALGGEYAQMWRLQNRVILDLGGTFPEGLAS